jgi:hypothetical protein
VFATSPANLIADTGPENVFYCGWGSFRRGGAVSPCANLYGLVSHNRGLVSANVDELDRPHYRRGPRFFRVEPRSER